MNGDDGGEGLEKAKREREKTPCQPHIDHLLRQEDRQQTTTESHQEAGLYPTL